MKMKLIFTIWSLLTFGIVTTTMPANAYTIGGAYVSLVSWDWGQWGNQYGNIGAYEDASGKRYQVFFGGAYCQY